MELTMPPKKIKKIKLLFIIIIVISLIIKIYCAFLTKSYSNNVFQKMQKQGELISNEQLKKGTTYYISSDGKSYSGTDINKPMSLSTAIRKNI